MSLVRQQHHLAHVIRPHNAWLADHDLKIYNEAHTKFGEQTTGTRKIKYTDTIQKPMPVTYTEKNTADMLASDLSDDDTVPLPSPVPTPYTPNTVAMHKQTTTNQLHIAQNPFTPLYSPIITKSSGIAWEIDRSALFDLPASNLSSISPLPSISSPAAPIPVFTPTSVFNTDIHENERLIYESKHIINTADSTTREENTQETTMESNTKENTDQQQHLQQSNGIDNDVPVILPKLPSPSLSFAMPASDLLFPLPAFVLSPAESASISSSVAESVSSVTIVSPPLSDHAALTTTAPPVAVSLVSTPPSLPSTQLPPRLANTLLLETIDYYLAQEKAKTIEVESILALSKVQSPPSVLSSLSPIVSPSVSSLWSPPLPVPSDSSDSENETSFNTSHIHSENKTENSNFVTPSAKHYFSLLKSLPSSVLSTVSPLPSTLDLSSDSFIQQSPAAHAIQQFITPIKHKHTTKREILQHLITQ